jgi:hypothetical protein
MLTKINIAPWRTFISAYFTVKNSSKNAVLLLNCLKNNVKTPQRVNCLLIFCLTFSADFRTEIIGMGFVSLLYLCFNLSLKI